MSEPGSITAILDDATFALVSMLAAERGLTNEEYAADAVRRFVADEKALREFLRQGEADFVRGDYSTHEELVEELRSRRHKKNAA